MEKRTVIKVGAPPPSPAKSASPPTPKMKSKARTKAGGSESAGRSSKAGALQKAKALPLHEVQVADNVRVLGVHLRNHPLGAMIISFMDGTASETDLRSGDVLVSVGGRKLSTDCREAAAALTEERVKCAEARRALTLGYHKAADAGALMLKKRSLPKLLLLDACGDAHKPIGGLGLTLAKHPLGLLCEAVEAGLPAAKGGLVGGDVIVTIGGHVVLDPDVALSRIAALTSLGARYEYLDESRQRSVQLHVQEPVRLTYYSASAAEIEVIVANAAWASLANASPTGSCSISQRSDVSMEQSASASASQPSTRSLASASTIVFTKGGPLAVESAAGSVADADDFTILEEPSTPRTTAATAAAAVAAVAAASAAPSEAPPPPPPVGAIGLVDVEVFCESRHMCSIHGPASAATSQLAAPTPSLHARPPPPPATHGSSMVVGVAVVHA